LGVLIAAFVAALLAAGIWLYPAFRFFSNYKRKVSTASPAYQRREAHVGILTVHVYNAGKPSKTAAILVPGLHPEGIYDPRFVAFAQNCAEAGFDIVAPDLIDFRNFHITEESVHAVRNTLDQLPHLLGTKPTRIGMLAISYGAGPVFVVASERKPDFIAAIGGYYSLSHAIEFSFAGLHPGSPVRAAHEWGRLIFAINHIDDLTGPPDVEILRSSLLLRLHLKVPEAQRLEANLTAAGNELLRGILNGLTPIQLKLFHDVLNKHQQEMQYLSVDHVVAKIDPTTRVYLLHGTTDNSVPYEETLELDAALKKVGIHPHTLITQELTHVDVTKTSRWWDVVKLLNWTRLLLRER
jgi:pimeloyl-ACP methyl ester carboxylesterase